MSGDMENNRRKRPRSRSPETTSMFTNIINNISTCLIDRINSFRSFCTTYKQNYSPRDADQTSESDGGISPPPKRRRNNRTPQPALDPDHSNNGARVVELVEADIEPGGTGKIPRRQGYSHQGSSTSTNRATNINADPSLSDAYPSKSTANHIRDCRRVKSSLPPARSRFDEANDIDWSSKSTGNILNVLNETYARHNLLENITLRRIIKAQDPGPSRSPINHYKTRNLVVPRQVPNCVMRLKSIATSRTIPNKTSSGESEVRQGPNKVNVNAPPIQIGISSTVEEPMWQERNKEVFNQTVSNDTMCMKPNPPDYCPEKPPSKVSSKISSQTITVVTKTSEESPSTDKQNESDQFDKLVLANRDKWECAMCLVRNERSTAKCVCCGSLAPNSKISPQTTTVVTKTSPSTDKQNESDQFNKLILANRDKWECPMCLVRNERISTKCVCCGSPAPNSKISSQTITAVTKTSEDSPSTDKQNESDKFDKLILANRDKWECAMCLVRNERSTAKCVCCGSPAPNSKISSQTTTVLTKTSPSTDKQNESDQFNKLILANRDKWECAMCLVRNERSTAKCVCCGSPAPNSKISSQTTTVVTKTSPSTDKQNESDQFNKLILANRDKWECAMCLVRNEHSIAKCVCCGSLAPNSKISSQTITAITKTSRETPSTNKQNESDKFDKLILANRDKWECAMCLVHNERISTKCVCCGSIAPNSGTNKDNSVPSFNFGVISRFDFQTDKNNSPFLTKTLQQKSSTSTPNPVHVDPTPVHVDPIPVYVDPTPVYVDPTPVHVDPTPVHVDPTPVHVDPTPGFSFAPHNANANMQVNPSPLDGDNPSPLDVDNHSPPLGLNTVPPINSVPPSVNIKPAPTQLPIPTSPLLKNPSTSSSALTNIVNSNLVFGATNNNVENLGTNRESNMNTFDMQIPVNETQSTTLYSSAESHVNVFKTNTAQGNNLFELLKKNNEANNVFGIIPQPGTLGHPAKRVPTVGHIFNFGQPQPQPQPQPMQIQQPQNTAAIPISQPISVQGVMHQPMGSQPMGLQPMQPNVYTFGGNQSVPQFNMGSSPTTNTTHTINRKVRRAVRRNNIR